MLKYTLNDKLNNIPHGEYSSRLKELLTILDVPKSTFHDWRRIQIHERRSIPAEKLIMIAKFFGCPIEEMISTSKKK